MSPRNDTSNSDWVAEPTAYLHKSIIKTNNYLGWKECGMGSGVGYKGGGVGYRVALGHRWDWGISKRTPKDNGASIIIVARFVLDLPYKSDMWRSASRLV